MADGLFYRRAYVLFTYGLFMKSLCSPLCGKAYQKCGGSVHSLSYHTDLQKRGAVLKRGNTRGRVAHDVGKYCFALGKC
jgi:hypothetical protein